MKKLFFAVSALAALALLAPSAGFAQTAFNQMGIYTDVAGTPESANYAATVNVPFFAYLVVTNPYNHSFGAGGAVEQPITNIDGFETKLILPADATFFMLSESFAVPGINIGTVPDYVVGFGTSVPVAGVATVLATFQFMALAPTTFDIFLGVTSIPSIAGTLAIVDGDDPTAANLQSVYPSTGDFAVPVFSVNGTNAVAVENESWGNVKSLYR